MVEVHAVWAGETPPDKTYLTSPADLCPRTRALSDLLCDCDISPAVSAPDGTASDFDFFDAVFRSLPRMPGHPLVRRFCCLLTALGYREPLSADSAPSVWQYLSQRLGPCEKAVSLADLADISGVSLLCPVRPDTALIGCTDLLTLDGLTRALDTICHSAQSTALFLPSDYQFVRPNPYAVGQVLKKATASGRFSWQPLTAVERDMLLTQAARVMGGFGYTHPYTNVVIGSSDIVNNLLSYLSSVELQPFDIRIINNPDADAYPLPAFANVRTGLWFDGELPPFVLRRQMQAYAERMPFDRLGGIYCAVRSPLDLTQPIEVKRVLNILYTEWANK